MSDHFSAIPEIDPASVRQPAEAPPLRELLLFNEIATLSSRNLDVPEVLELILRSIIKYIGVAAGMLLLWDPRSGRLSHAASKGFPSEYLAKIDTAQLSEVAGPFLMNATSPLIIHDAATDQRLATSTFSELIRDASPFCSLVSIPLRHRRQLIGFLNLAHTSPEPFPRNYMSFFAILGNQIGMAIQNARLNQDLRLSERRYRRIFEGSQDMILVVSPDGSLQDINPAGVELLGYASKSEALESLLFPDCFYSLRDWERFQLLLEMHSSLQDREVTLSRRDGGVVLVLLSGTARRSRSGQLTGFDVIAKNITERKRIEQEILQEKKTTEGILEGLPVPVFVIDRQHRVTYWNRACEELTGYSRQQMIGSSRQWLPFYSQERPTLVDLVMDQNIKALENYYKGQNLRQAPHFPGAFEATLRFPRLGASERHLFLMASPIFSDQGQIIGAVQAMLDITERERLAQNLKESERKYRHLVETSLDGIALHTQDRVLFANSSLLQMFGYSHPEELAGVNLLCLISPIYHAALLRHLREISRRFERPRIFEIKGLKKDGSEFDIEVGSLPTSFEGYPVFQTHVRDVTDKKRLEDQLARSEKLAALGQLAAGVAHEINNPLGAILVYSYLMLEDLAPENPERLQVEKIIKEAMRCKEIIKGLLDFSRQLPYRQLPVDINALITEMFHLVENHLSFQNISLDKNLAADLPPVMGDKSRLEQVFINLFMNAGDAMGGQGRLTVTTRQNTLGAVEIRLSDTGPGIHSDHLPRLFDPFFSTKEVGRGVGLGLSISYGIIKQHRGRIYADASASGGATFVIELPVVRP
ncbi:MAG: PAS domain S-box protein [Deltaproteobacteria bacterium]|nr:PAS domain S-box protein [Deltaproteobacteria bacterium]